MFPGEKCWDDDPEQTRYALRLDPRSIHPSSRGIIPLRSCTRWPDWEEVERTMEGNPWYDMDDDNDEGYPLETISPGESTSEQQSAPVQPPWLLRTLGWTPQAVGWEARLMRKLELSRRVGGLPFYDNSGAARS